MAAANLEYTLLDVLSYAERRPPEALVPFLECLWLVKDRKERAARPPERVVPDGCPEIIVHLADRFARRVGERWVVQPQLFLVGTLTRPWLLRAGRRVRTLGIRFRPGQLHRLLRFRMDLGTDREVPLRDVVGESSARELKLGISEQRTDSGRFEVAESWLLRRLRAAPPKTLSSRCQPALDLILEARGQARIDAVAESLGWSRRRLERLFRDEIGVSPKLYSRIVRLNVALASLDAAERPSAVDFALDAGYFDQAHLLRDFRSLAGRTPRTPRESDGEMARHFTSPERLRLLFAGE